MADRIMELSTPPCAFLRVPKEIRLQIYRYLLLADPHIQLLSDKLFDESQRAASESNYTPEILDEIDLSGTEGAEGNWTDEEDDSDMSAYDYSDYDLSSVSSDDTFSRELKLGHYKRHFAIVSTSKQIYSEAMSLFYSEAKVAVDPGDLFCLMKKPRHMKIEWVYACPWKHNPLKGIGCPAKGGLGQVYHTLELTGDVEPHIFAKFEKFVFDGIFGEEYTPDLELWIDDITHVIRTEDAEKFTALLRSSTIFKDLTTILRSASRIKELEISLEVEIVANSNIIMHDMQLASDDDEDNDPVDRIEMIANEKATELLVDSGVLEPLRQLNNVQKFDIDFGFAGLPDIQKYDRPERYVKKFREMKLTIEGNFKEVVA